MSSRITNTLNPRSYVYSSNAETLVLESQSTETRLSFINASASENFRYVISSLNQQLGVYSINNNVQTNFVKYENYGGTPTVNTYGTLVTSNLSFMQTSTKLISFKNLNPVSSHDFVGIGLGNNAETSNSMVFQVPSTVYGYNKYIFKNGTNELIRFQADASGNPQLGIGTTTIAPNVGLHVVGDTTITGALFVGGLNFATGYVKVDVNTQRISCNIMPTGLVYVSGASNQIDNSLLPMAFQSQYFKTNKNFGIGTRTPVQRLHVAGSVYVTDRIGIGASQPSARLDIIEYASVIPAAKITNTTGGDILQTYISQGAGTKVPVLTIVGTHAGVGIGTSSVNLANALEIHGTTQMNGTLRLSSNVVMNGGTFTGTVSAFSLNTVTDNASVLSTNIDSTQSAGSKVSLVCGVPLNVARLTVTNNLQVLGTTYLQTSASISDLRLKKNINVIPNALTKLDLISGYTYNMIRDDTTSHAGVIAQEVAKVVPEAVSTIPNTDYLAVDYNAVIALLVESVKDLSSRVRTLENKLAEMCST